MGVVINGTDLSTLGIGETRVRGWADAPRESRSAVQLGGQWGQVEGSVETVRPRTLSIEGFLKGETVGSRIEALEEHVALWRGRAEIRPPDHTDRVVVGRLERFEVEGLTDLLTFARGMVRVRLDFTCYSPMYRDASAQVVAFTSTATDVPMGTGPNRGVITISSEPTDPTITVKDFRGDTVATMEFSGTLTATQSWEVDLDEHTLTLDDSGVESDDPTALVDGAFFHFEADWSEYGASSWPTIEIDAGSGSISYFRRWRL